MNKETLKKHQLNCQEGMETTEELRSLKKSAVDPYFATLEKEKSTLMNWSFDDFMEEVAPKTEVQKIGWWTIQRSIAVAASICLLIGIGWLFLTPPATKLAKKDVQPQEEIQPKKIEELEQPLMAKSEDQPVERKVVQRKKKAKLPPSSDYHPEYVIVNGKPIYDLEEATRVTMDALGFFSENISSTIAQAEPVKHMSINY